jgi:type IV secretion system protein VirD4
VIFLRSRKAKEMPAGHHGTAQFASERDLQEFIVKPTEGALPAGSFYLSHSPNGIIALPRMRAVQHGLILGGSGTGKSRGYFMPNCAWAKNTSIVVTDPKGELWKYTSGFHDKPLRYAPAEPEASECFNWVPLCKDPRIAQLCARAIMDSGNSQKTDQFWLEAETAFLSALFAHASTLDVPTPLTAYRLFTRQRPEQLLEQLLNSDSEAAREEAIVFSQTDPRIKGGIVPGVASKLQFLRDPNAARFTSAAIEPPNFGRLRRDAYAVYYCMREQDISRLRPLTSLFFTVLLEQIAGTEAPDGATGTPITMMLDEFANLGTIPDFATTISLARGRGAAIWIGLQSLAQLEARYGKANAQTIITNCATKAALHGLDVLTAKYVSEMLGDATAVVPRVAYNDGGGGSRTYSTTDHRRPLLTPDEVMRIGENEAIVRTGNRYPMRLLKFYYDEKPCSAQVKGLGQALSEEFAPSAGSEREPIDDEPPPIPPRRP